MLFLFEFDFVLGLLGQALHESVEVGGLPILVIECVFLLDDVLHHAHADRVLLLVVLLRAWILEHVAVDALLPLSLVVTPSAAGWLLFDQRDHRIVGARSHLAVFDERQQLALLLRVCLLLAFPRLRLRPSELSQIL